MRTATRRKLQRLAVEALESREVPATFVVTTTADVVNAADHKLSLREAIDLANAKPDVDTIVLSTGFYQNTLGEFPTHPDSNFGGDFDLRNPVTIRGVGASKSVVIGHGLVRLFDVIGPIKVAFTGLTIREGGGSFDGAAIHAQSGDITVRNAVLARNQSTKGGAIDDETGNVTLIGSQITRNTSDSDGGGINMGTGKLILVQSSIDANLAASSGGGISSQGTVSLSQTTVTNNTASASAGGGIWAQTLTADRSEISGNSAPTAAGGGIEATSAKITNSRLWNNTALMGGGMWADDATLTKSNVEGNAATGNSILSRGGGLGGNTIAVTESTIAGNSADVRGGGISTLTLTNVETSVVARNTAGSAGGGLDSEDTVHVQTSTIVENSAGFVGGGLSAPNVIKVEDSTISANRAPNGGGAFATTANLTNVTVSGNTASAGGGLCISGGSLVNVTITQNRATISQGGGIKVLAATGQTVDITNSIVAGNTAVDRNSGFDVIGAFRSGGHNLIGDTTHGIGFIASDLTGDSANPLDPRLGPLADNGGPTLTHALLAGSPAIDAGDGSFATSVDQRGHKRIRDGNRDGKAVIDIGAFER